MEKCFGNFSKMEWRKWLELQFSRKIWIRKPSESTKTVWAQDWCTGGEEEEKNTLWLTYKNRAKKIKSAPKKWFAIKATNFNFFHFLATLPFVQFSQVNVLLILLNSLYCNTSAITFAPWILLFGVKMLRWEICSCQSFYSSSSCKKN